MTDIPFTPSPNEILDNISMLYELSLGIGTSLNLQENCDFFVQKLMSRQNLSFVAIYADDSIQNFLTPSLNSTKQYSCIHISPQLSFRELEQIIPLQLLFKVQTEGRLSLKTQDPRHTILPRAVHELFPGIFSALSVCQGKMIVILINQVRQCEYNNWQLNQLQLLLNKFGRSVEACFNHESLRQATQAKIALEKKLGKVQQLESLGLMASGIAHDLGNILNPLSAYPAMLESAFPEGSREKFMLSQMQEAVDKAHEMMQELLMMTRREHRCHDTIPLALPIFQYFKSASFLSLQAEEPHVSCRWELNSNSCVLADNVMLTRIIMNLVINAFDALHGQGDIEVLVDDYDFPGALEWNGSIPAGQYVGLTVKDNGAGIPSDALAHIFEPFFSQKKLGRSGSGLGLAVVRSIVDGLNGVIDVQTGAEGTSFMIYFPRLATESRKLAFECPQGEIETENVKAFSSGLHKHLSSQKAREKHRLSEPNAPVKQSARNTILNGIALMNEGWIGEFKTALSTLKIQNIEEQIDKIPMEHKQLKRAIKALSNAYRYDILLELISEVEPR